MSGTNHLPPGTSAVTPYVCVRRCSAAIDWYAAVFGAVEDGPRYTDPDGRRTRAGGVIRRYRRLSPKP